MRTSDGEIRWLHRYPRRKEPVAREIPAHFRRDPAPAVPCDGLLIVAPSDTPSVFALDVDTGQLLWSSDELAEAVELIGIVEGRLIASGPRLWSVDAYSGRVQATWPDERDAKLRGLGRGLVAGHEVFWPTANEIVVVDVATCRPTRPPVDIKPLGGFGSNLIMAGGYLIAAGNDRIMAYGGSAVQDAPRQAPTDSGRAPP